MRQIKNSILFSFVGIALAGCTTVSNEQRQKEYEEQSARRLEERKVQLKQIKDQYIPKDSTAEDLALAKKLSGEYYSGLIKSISAIDDGISPADSVARAAVSENIDLMRSWKRAQMAHLARPSAWTAQEVEKAIVNLPSKGLIDEATSIVLRMRKSTLFDRSADPEP